MLENRRDADETERNIAQGRLHSAEVLLTVHLSIILVTGQLNAPILVL